MEQIKSFLMVGFILGILVGMTILVVMDIVISYGFKKAMRDLYPTPLQYKSFWYHAKTHIMRRLSKSLQVEILQLMDERIREVTLTQKNPQYHTNTTAKTTFQTERRTLELCKQYVNEVFEL